MKLATPPRTTLDHHLLIQASARTDTSPLLSLVRRIADAGCNLADSRLNTIGNDSSLMLLATGSWDAIAKLESGLAKIAREEGLKLSFSRAAPRQQDTQHLPYLVEIIAADHNGLLAHVIEFFVRQGVHIEQMHSIRYRAMQTGADMFQAQLTVGIPAQTHIAHLREDFLELCDGLNLDAIIDPVKF